jgi:hypothetical protein
MIFKLKVGHWRFTLTMYLATHTHGVNSNLPDGNHILMWDFDDVPLKDVDKALRFIQREYDLPQIYLLHSGKANHFLAYCFKRLRFEYTISIIAMTPEVCYNFFRFGVMRKYFTLRIDKKEGRKPHLLYIIPSPVKEDVALSELEHFTFYETCTDNNPRRIITIPPKRYWR